MTETIKTKFLKFIEEGSYNEAYALFEKHREGLISKLDEDEIINSIHEIRGYGMVGESQKLVECAKKTSRIEGAINLRFTEALWDLSDYYRKTNNR